MKNRLTIIPGILLFLLWNCPSVPAQQATEFHIPVGQSPGVSHTTSLIGKIFEFNAQTRRLTFESPAGSWTTLVEEKTRIWMDRSRLTLPNQVGSLSDLQEGRLVEVKYKVIELRGRGAAEWIKVQLPAANSNLGKNRNEGSS